MKRIHVQHLYQRAGFGLDPVTLNTHVSKERAEVVEQFFDRAKQIQPLEIDLSEFKSIDIKKLLKKKGNLNIY